MEIRCGCSVDLWLGTACRHTYHRLHHCGLSMVSNWENLWKTDFNWINFIYNEAKKRTRINKLCLVAAFFVRFSFCSWFPLIELVVLYLLLSAFCYILLLFFSNKRLQQNITLNLLKLLHCFINTFFHNEVLICKLQIVIKIEYNAKKFQFITFLVL